VLSNELGDFKGRVTLRLNYRLKGCVLRQHLWTARHREWLCDNFVAKVFTQETL